MYTTSDALTMNQPVSYYNSQNNQPVMIELQDVAVQYRMPTERINSLKETAIRAMKGKKVKHNEFWALRKFNLQIRRGEAVAFVGRNGAGKSTTLKVVARVQKPTQGRVVVRGQVAPLIELGAGFHPELTGRENIFLNGAMLGYSREEMQKLTPQIIEFSELGEFINSPLRTYSSGMQARLGFSVAASVDADVLIIDEALSVGDESFQKKCIDRMKEFKRKGTTILFVTHSLDQITTLCERSVWIDAGRMRYDGPTEKVVAMFRDSLEHDNDLAETRMRQIVQVFRK